MNNVILDLNGLSPSDDLLLFLNNKLENLQAQSPSDSHIEVSLSQDGEYIYGEITVFNATERFHTTCFETSMSSLLFRLFDDIEKQVIKWKYLRCFNVPKSA